MNAFLFHTSIWRTLPLSLIHIFDLAGFYNVGKAVHLSETHAHTFQSRSSRNSRFTVFHTCCAAPVLDVYKRQDALPTLIPAAVQAIVTIVQGLVDSLPMLLDAALDVYKRQVVFEGSAFEAVHQLTVDLNILVQVGNHHATALGMHH